MRVVSHTCSNTEIVCALGCAQLLVGVDDDSDFPADAVAGLPKLGRDLELDVAQVRALRPDLVLTSLTVPGHERIVGQLRATGFSILVIDPRSLADVFASVETIADALGCPARGRELARRMREAMPPIQPRGARPKLLVEWWPKPVIAPAHESWVTDLIGLAGGCNPWGETAGKSVQVSDPAATAASPDAIVMSWCGVKEDKYRADVVLRRPGWERVPAVARRCIYPVTEAFLGRPGPRLVKGYQALRRIVAECGSP